MSIEKRVMAKPITRVKRVVVAALVAVALACAGFVVWAGDYCHASDTASEVISTQAVTSDSFIAFGDPSAE